jgi:hypothetical protein
MWDEKYNRRSYWAATAHTWDQDGIHIKTKTANVHEFGKYLEVREFDPAFIFEDQWENFEYASEDDEETINEKFETFVKENIDSVPRHTGANMTETWDNFCEEIGISPENHFVRHDQGSDILAGMKERGGIYFVHKKTYTNPKISNCQKQSQNL